jgi:hypothetical protein
MKKNRVVRFGALFHQILARSPMKVLRALRIIWREEQSGQILAGSLLPTNDGRRHDD